MIKLHASHLFCEFAAFAELRICLVKLALEHLIRQVFMIVELGLFCGLLKSGIAGLRHLLDLLVESNQICGSLMKNSFNNTLVIVRLMENLFCCLFILAPSDYMLLVHVIDSRHCCFLEDWISTYKQAQGVRLLWLFRVIVIEVVAQVCVVVLIRAINLVHVDVLPTTVLLRSSIIS